ncbi:NYN domain-containing protein [Candidatus Dependentiae bacterium]|nr:NYN domain-containing protein [Candidatus Dependentiae bacterium]
MIKAMMFIDGTWLFTNRYFLKNSYGDEIHLDYQLLPKVLLKHAQESMGLMELDLVRIFLFGSIAINYNLIDDDYVQKRSDFFEMLQDEFNYDLHVFTIDFKGRRLSKLNRDPNDNFEPKEKCVDIALATNLLYFAAIPNAYDIAICVVGDRDYLPALKFVRQLGKRVVLVSIKESCSNEFIDPLKRSELRDSKVIWLNNIATEFELKYTETYLDCESPLHEGDKKILTFYKPRKGKPFYCDECRAKFSEQKSLAQEEFISNTLNNYENSSEEFTPGMNFLGTITKIVHDKGYGFIKSIDGKDYFFHLTDLENFAWESIKINVQVFFQVKKEPFGEKAGAASKVKLALNNP